MKNLNITKHILALLLFLMSLSCQKDLIQEPITNKVSSKFYSTEGELESAVTSVYATLQSRGLYGLYIPAIGEVPSDNSFEEVPGNDGGYYGALDGFSVTVNNGIIADIWRTSYIGIQRANIVLNRIDDVSFDQQSIKESRIGEVKFIRALIYFNLVRLYGDVPLVIKETQNPNDYFGQGRASVEAVYTQIKKDLTESIGILPQTGSDDSRVTKGAAQTLLGKVYLTLKQFDEAKVQFDAVVNSSKYILVPNVSNIFGVENENNSEVIFAVQFESGLDGDSEGSNAYQQFSPSGTVSGAKGHNIPTEELLEKYDFSDERLSAYYTLSSKSSLYYTNKLTANPIKAQDGPSDWIVLRYSDVVLMLAEVENELANTARATTLLNSIRIRAGLSGTNVLTQIELRDAIALERRLELAIEGQRWFDLLRTDKALEVVQANGISIQEEDLLMPIPQNQIDTDLSLGQNPGY